VKPALERIVVGMDFGAPSMKAARWVATTVAPGAELILTHAVNDHATAVAAAAGERRNDLATAAAQLHDVARALPVDRYRVEVRDDGAVRAIVAVAAEYGADLIVVGPHGGRETTRGIGTTAERLIRTSSVPVLLVASPRTRVPKQLLVPVDGGRLTHMVLDWADFISRRVGAGLALMHVREARLEDNGDPLTLPDDRWLSKLAAESPEPDLSTSFTVAGKPADEILAAAIRLDADLVIMGRRGRRRALSGVVGSTASDLLRHASCPVLIVVDPPDAIFDEWVPTESQQA
jgi:nucleotide-binding universal stress UspA family protein